MKSILLQDKINNLHNSAYRLLHIECSGNYLYVDDLSVLNQSIHEQINELYLQSGETIEQEASLCLALLLGFSVSLYANPDDEFKRKSILDRAQKLLTILSPSSLRRDLLILCEEYV